MHTRTHTQGLDDFPRVERKEDYSPGTFITLYTCERDWKGWYGVNRQDNFTHTHTHYIITYK